MLYCTPINMSFELLFLSYMSFLCEPFELSSWWTYLASNCFLGSTRKACAWNENMGNMGTEYLKHYLAMLKYDFMRLLCSWQVLCFLFTGPSNKYAHIRKSRFTPSRPQLYIQFMKCLLPVAIKLSLLPDMTILHPTCRCWIRRARMYYDYLRWTRTWRDEVWQEQT